MQNFISPKRSPQELQEETVINDAFRGMLKIYLNSNHRRKVEIIERAFRFACDAHKGIRRQSGEPYVLHPIAVARIAVEELGLGSTSICAALLHDVAAHTDYSVDDLRHAFGDKIASIVEGISKISGGILATRASVQAENFRNLLLSMSTDVRVILVKMADRLHNMRTLVALNPEKQLKIADETLHIYAPLAHRLGLYKMKTELEELAFKYEHPRVYQEIISKIESTESSRRLIVEDFVNPIRKKLDEAGYRYEIKARVKSAYSIFNKMQRKGVPFEEVYDIYAVRIIFDNDDDSLENERCREIYRFFAEGHTIHPDRVRDWTSIPKANGYRALHLTALGPAGKWIEVQIRSRKMDDIAELGYAAHWKYKTGEEADPSRTELEAWMNRIKDILARPEPDTLDFLDTIRLSVYSREIYVFTPKRDLFILPAGATVLDMAFAVHTHLGLHCVAGKIHHRLLPISHTLESGDQVEIITSEKEWPSPDWLNSCRSARAHNKIRSFLRHSTHKK